MAKSQFRERIIHNSNLTSHYKRLQKAEQALPSISRRKKK